MVLKGLFQRLPFRQSLRWQFRVSLLALEVLVVAGSLIAISALRVSNHAIQELAEARLMHMEEAQDLVKRVLLIESGTERMVAANSRAEMRQRYDETIEQMNALDRVAEKLSRASADVSVLDLQHSEQMFRNAAVIVAQLKDQQLQNADTNAPAMLSDFPQRLDQDALGMVAAAQELSRRFTSDYRDAVRRVADTSRRTEGWLAAFFIASLAIAWQVSRHFNRQVLARLQAVSDCLRQPSRAAARVPVEGADEISEMARAVESFLADRQRLAEANEELESFSYTISHDLRAPLRAVDGFCGLLEDRHQQQLDETGRSYLKKIQLSAERMTELIKDILAFSRMSRSEMAVEPVDLGALVKEVFDEERRLVRDRKITLRVGELPPAKGDSALIRQVLVNVMSNAIKFSAARPEAIVEVDCTEHGAMNTYRVRDNGVGFDARNAARLFGVFQRFHTEAEFEGTGIGLAIVKRIIVRHGGRVWAESMPGEGTSVYFTLPGAGGF